MALIPTDVGVNLRLPSDTALQPTTPVSGIPGDLPDLQPGQVFTANIQEVLPENTYRALVAGKTVTLALPEGANAGDVLELLVVDRSAKAILAKPVQDASAGNQTYEHTTLSPAARMIGDILSEDPGSHTAPLNRGQPLLEAPPTNAGALASALQKAVEGSGMFYEAHQAQWIAGKRPVESLLSEPQGRFSSPDTAKSAGSNNTATRQPDANLTTLRRDMLAQSDKADTADSATAARATLRDSTQNQPLPNDLRPLVHQQLEAAANQRLIWHGEAWPGQAMDWQIEEDKQHSSRDESEPSPWQTTLRLTTPRLGSIEAKLRISGNNLQINLSTAVGATAADMRDELPALTDALAAAGLTLQSAQVRHEQE